jgi:hypothetical protein
MILIFINLYHHYNVLLISIHFNQIYIIYMIPCYFKVNLFLVLNSKKYNKLYYFRKFILNENIHIYIYNIVLTIISQKSSHLDLKIHLLIHSIFYLVLV